MGIVRNEEREGRKKRETTIRINKKMREEKTEIKVRRNKGEKEGILVKVRKNKGEKKRGRKGRDSINSE